MMINPTAANTPQSRSRLLAGLAAVLFLVLQFLIFSGMQPRLFNDSTGYLNQAGEALTSPTFWNGLRPFTIPLFYKLCQADAVRIAWLQFVFSAAAWIFLAISLANRMRTRLGSVAAFGLMLLGGLAPDVLFWQKTLLSESLSLTFLIATTAALLEFTRSPNQWRWSAAAIFGVLWAFTRETNTYLLLILAVILALLSLRKTAPTRRRFFALAFVFALTVVIGQTALNNAQRWYTPFLHRISTTILPYPQRVAYYQSLGMPHSPELLALAGPWTTQHEQALNGEPALQPFAAWYAANGKRAYESFLISHPLDALSGPLQDWQMLVNTDLSEAYAPEGFRPLLPTTLTNLLYLKNPALLLASFLVAMLYGLWIRWKEGTFASSAPMGFLLLISLVNYVLSWLGDGWEVERHILPASIGLRLAAWMALLLAFDLLWQGQRDLRRLLQTHPAAVPVLLLAGLTTTLFSLFGDRLTGSSNTGFGLSQFIGTTLGLGLLVSAIVLSFMKRK